MIRALLVHWNREEAEDRIRRLRSAGIEAEAAWEGPPAVADARRLLPDVIIIDLARLPSHGKAVALAFRSFKATRRIPLVFLAGDAEKTAALKALLPDAVFTTWGRVGPAVKRAVAHPPESPLNPESKSGPYSGTPLPKKLGMKPGSTLAIEGAPEGFEATLGVLPEGAATVRGTKSPSDLTLWFSRSRAEFLRGLPRMKPRAAGGGLWIAWPKKASGVATDLSEPVIRDSALAAGLVDFKVCAIDATWSGLRFSIRGK